MTMADHQSTSPELILDAPPTYGSDLAPSRPPPYNPNAFPARTGTLRNACKYV